MEITVNGKQMPLSDNTTTVAHLIEQMQLTGKRIAIERNGEIVPRSQFAQVPIQAGDRLEIVGAVGGG